MCAARAWPKGPVPQAKTAGQVQIEVPNGVGVAWLFVHVTGQVARSHPAAVVGGDLRSIRHRWASNGGIEATSGVIEKTRRLADALLTGPLLRDTK